MAVLPYNRVVNVNLTRNDNFPSRRGFGTLIILTTDDVTGEVDATTRTKLYGTIDEVVEDYATSTSVYKAALAAFSQNPRPVQIKVGYVIDDGTMTAAELQAQLDLVNNYDGDWYFVTVDSTLRDIAAIDGLIEWIQAKNKLAIIDSNASGTESSADTATVAARNKNEFDRSGVFYHTDAAMYGAASLAAYMATRNFDDADTAYTAKFKALPGVSSVNLASAKISAITGFTPGIGQSSATGHMANTYIDIGGQKFVVEGSTLTQNVFLDEIHAQDWIIARTEEELLAILLNNARVPFTDAGMETLASAVRTVMQAATRAGLIAQDLNDVTGEYEPAVTITVPSVFDVTESQRKSRVAPAIVCRFRYAGAIHYATVNYFMNF
jgi:hypothetical protein